MKKLLFASIVLWSSIASARNIRSTIVTRVSADVYKLSDGTVIHTVGCTESAMKQPAIIDEDGIRSNIVFADANGEVEEQCRVASVDHKRIMVARR